MDKQKAITLAGSQSELARILGITRAAVHNWKTIPTGRLYQLMILRPDWFVQQDCLKHGQEWIDPHSEKRIDPSCRSFFQGLLGLKKMYYYQFNIGDYQSHTSHLSEMEDLAYRRLLDWYYLHETPIPLEINEVARQIRMRSHTDCIANVLREYFERITDGWVHHRANKEIAKAGDKSEKASASAKARWGKKDANALPTQSEGNATHNTLPITQDTEHKTQKKATVVACPPDVSEQVWNDWLQLRKTKKASVTETVLKGARSEANKIGWSLEQFLIEWCTRGSQGLKAEWLKEKLTKSEERQNVMAELTRGKSIPKTPFWAKPETVILEAQDVERKRLL